MICFHAIKELLKGVSVVTRKVNAQHPRDRH